MKKSDLNTLDPAQMKVLTELTRLLIEQYNPENIFCFGCKFNSEKNINAFTDIPDKVDRHYYLLMLTTETARMENTVQSYVTNTFDKAEVTILVHSSETLNNAVVQGHRFFNAVCRNGIQLYSGTGLTLTLDYPRLNPVTTLANAERYYKHYYGLASGFMESAGACIDNDFYNNCVFLLHQVMEQACITIIRVYTAYRADIHNIARLLNLCQCFINEPAELFPRKRQEDKRLFELLLKSYSEARYDDKFKVGDHDADVLFTRVSEFLKLTEILCNRRLSEYGQAVKEAAQANDEYSPEMPAQLFPCN
jgi:HEPN domain-containing protein